MNAGFAWFLAGAAVVYVVVKRRQLPLPAPVRQAADSVAEATTSLWGDARSGVDAPEAALDGQAPTRGPAPTKPCMCHDAEGALP